jgi:hypothetical protein
MPASMLAGDQGEGNFLEINHPLSHHDVSSWLAGGGAGQDRQFQTTTHDGEAPPA